MLNNENTSVNELSKDYNVSTGTLYRIKNDLRLITNPEALRNVFRFKIHEEEKVVKCMQEFLEHQVTQFNTSDVSKFVEKNLGYNYPLQKIRNTMKQEFSLSYKRINSRPSNIDLDKLQLTRILFSMRVSKLVDSDILLINIDESSLTKATKLNYSWVPTDENGEVLNTNFTNSLNIVLAICSNGSWIEMLTNDTLNIDRFVVFLQNLKAWQDENNKFWFKNIMILLDNLASHRTNKVIDFCKKWNFRLCYIPPYSPTLAPVELVFSVLKRKLVSKEKQKSINLCIYEGYNLAVKSMKEIDAIIIKNCYSHFYEELKNNISRISSWI